MRILTISSQVAFGLVGNSVAVPALQASGHEVMAIPTVMLSNHPGFATPAGFSTTPEDLRAIYAALLNFNVFGDGGAIFTGYFTSAGQIHETAAMIREAGKITPPPYILVDPILGDGAALYVPESVAFAIRDELIPLANCITPNRFELEWLTGLPVTGETQAVEAVRRLTTPEVLATSIPAGEDQLITLLVTSEGVRRHVSPKLPHVPHGTGDLLSGLYLGARMTSSPQAAFASAMKTLDRAVARSAGSTVLDVAGTLHGS